MHSNNVNKLFRLTAITNSILFLIVIVAVSSISFSTVTNILYSELSIANRTILYQTMQNVDSQLKNIDIYISNLAKNREINNYVFEESPSPLIKYEIKQTLSDAVSKNGMINDIILYSGVTKNVFSYSDTKNTFETMMGIAQNALYENKQGWVDVENAGGKLIFVKHLYNKKGVIIVEVSETLLYEAISKYRAENKNGTFFVVNRKGIVLSHSNKAYIGTNISSESYTPYILSEKPSDEPYETMYQNQKTLMFSGKSGYTGWAYISAIPTSMFMTPINRGKIKIYVLSLIIFLISVTLAYLLVKKMYKPVDKFVHSVASSIMKNHSSEQIRQNFGSFNDLEKTLSDLIEEQRVLQSEYQKNAKALSWNIVMNMLLGFDTNYDKFIPMLETTNISLYPRNFVVVMFDISPSDDLKNFKSDEFMLIFNVIQQKLDNLITQETKGCSCVVGDHSIFAIISFENHSESENVSYAISIANDLIEFSKKNFEYTVCASIGRFYEEVSGLHKSYNEAVCAMKYKAINQGDSILMIDNYLSGYEGNENLKSISDMVNGIVKEFKNFSDDDLKEYCGKLLSKMHTEGVTVEICRQFVLQTIMLIVNQYIKPLELYTHSQISGKYLNSNQIIDSCTDIKTTIDNMQKILSDILETYKQSQNISYSQNTLASQVIEYIDENYMDPNTSLNAAAEKFDVSDSHLSRVFKASTGKRFMEYLIYKRIEKAKELLVSSQHKINDISSLVGYDNQISFMRIFKKYVGYTPSEYRSMYADKDKNI